MQESKVYVPKSSARKIEFKNGGSMLKLGFHAETLIEFLRTNCNDRGYVNLCVTERRQPSEKGDTHCIWLDQWKPGEGPAPARQAIQTSAHGRQSGQGIQTQPAGSAAQKKENEQEEGWFGDVPF